MGVVLSATHVHLHEQVAIKLLHPLTAQHPGAVERFLREARVAMKLRGEHAVRILDVGMLPDGAPFIAMEFLQGATSAPCSASRRCSSPPSRAATRSPRRSPDRSDWKASPNHALPRGSRHRILA
ncbi:MAG TPA: hypothetical protein VGI39_33745 [Polyangiaceae bacterium]|jgi:serine/threonine protein kinase